MSVSLPPRAKSSRIDVSLPIVNIVLLLIFFFLITGQIASNEIGDEIQLPASHALPLDQLPRPLLMVDPQGEWLLDGRPVAADLLEVALDEMPQPVTLHVLLDRAAPANQLIGILEHPALTERSVKLVTLRERSAE